MKAMIRQHLYWLTLHADECTYCSDDNVYQCTKKKKIKYSLLAEKVTEADPWEVLYVDLIELYTI